MIEKMAEELAAEIRRSPEYCNYMAAREKVAADEQTQGLLRRFHHLQMKVQAGRMADVQNGQEEQELKKLAELLQFSPDAANYLMAEFNLNRLLTSTYDIIGRGVGVVFSDWGK